MVVPTPKPATLEDLARVEGKAELIGGRIIQFMPSGHLPTLVAVTIYLSLRDYTLRTGLGIAYPDGMGFAMRPPMPSGREAFSPDAAYYTGPPPANRMSFIDGPPDFAVEVRSEYDYGPANDVRIAEKRADYFLAGAVAVWDVDPVAETVTLYRNSDPATPVVFGRRYVANPEPAVPGWRMAVDDIFG